MNKIHKTIWICIFMLLISFCICYSSRLYSVYNKKEAKPFIKKIPKTKHKNLSTLVASNILDYIWYRESRCGKDENWKLPKPTGEVGEYQIRPIFIEDVIRISGYIINPMDNKSCRKGVRIWLDHYVSYINKNMTINDQYELYNRGYKGS